MLNCKFRSYIKPWWYVLDEKFCFYNNNKIILVFKIRLYLFKFTFVFKEINARNIFWNINKLTIGCSETTFSKNFYRTETNQMICNTKQLVGFKMVLIFSERYFETDMNPFPANIPFIDQSGSWFLLAKCVKNTCGRVTS